MIEPPQYAAAEFVRDPQTGELYLIEQTNEYTELLRQFYDSYCKHEERSVFRHKTANGMVQVRECCPRCGQGFGSAMSQKNKAWVETVPWLSENLEVDYFDLKGREKRDLLLELGRKQRADRGAFTHSYTSYLASAEWKAKRALVLKRCKAVCEGCGVNTATEVHHHHYDHLFDELLFELVGLCHDCHERITIERREYREASLKSALERRSAFASHAEKEK